MSSLTVNFKMGFFNCLLLKDLGLTSLMICLMEYLKPRSAQCKIDGLLHGMVLTQEDETLTRSAVQTICGEVNIPKVESVILNI